MTRSRRTVLASLGVALLAPGCLASPADRARDDADSTDPGDTRSASPTPGGTPPGTPGGRPTETPDETPTRTPPGNPTLAERFRGEPCPSFTGADRTVCAHTRPAGAPLHLEPSATVLRVDPDAAVETITFTLHNDTGGPLGLNPHAWAVHRKGADGWTRVAPDVHIEPLVELPHGATFGWVLSPRPHPTPRARRTLYPTADVGNGRHAFAVEGRIGSTGGNGGSADGDADAGGRVECVALFDVEGVDDAPATPTPRPDGSGGDRIGD
jgi:hypothetical protein